MNRKQIVLGGLIVGALAAPAWANVGTALIWAYLLHLWYGCAVLGIVEGSLWGVVAKHRWGTLITVGVMVLANYASGWAGVYLIPVLASGLRATALQGELIDVAHSLFWTLFVLAFFVTILIEWPFVWARTGFRSKRIWKSLRVCAALHVVSYPLLAAWYFAASSSTLYTQATRDDSLDFVPSTMDARVFFLDPLGNVRCVPIRGGNGSVFYAANATGADDRLYGVRPDDGSYDLTLVTRGEVGREIGQTVRWTDFARQSSTTELGRADTLDEHLSTLWMRGSHDDLRPLPARLWTVETDFWSSLGLQVRNPEGSRDHGIAFANVLMEFGFSDAVILEGDMVVFELTARVGVERVDYICVYDPHSRTWGVLARGRSPVVAIGLKDPLPHPPSPAAAGASPSP